MTQWRTSIASPGCAQSTTSVSRNACSPDFEANAYSKTDEARGIGSGLSDLKIGLRLRYEIRRQFAPYIGVVWGKKLGNTADLARVAGERTTDKQIVAGVRIWF
ncbi:copper resistance protein B [Cupriavidus pinatubonensis]|jgi:copper resistance protein B|uniref:Copper resistance B n=1 Tax=Cupriavidus pinatubonensis TaxID=248026 RepID=A0ABN7Y209_9BURK|nr:copper resistance protein B [Cupriavidus pinatubonensis]CAG9166456.1 hypothetical protein LMG23994_00996 [Cupriavidus pinatubonensis]